MAEARVDRARTLAAIARRTISRGGVVGDALLVRDVTIVHRVLFLGLAFEVGLLAELRHGRADRARLAAAIGAEDEDLLEAVLRLGMAVGEVRVDRAGRWRLVGARARALARAGGDAQGAFVQEVLSHDAPGFDAVARRLVGETVSFDYLRHDPALVARSSRIVEPVLAEVVTGVVRSSAAATVLDAGCGSGAYLRHAVLSGPAVRAVGIDLDPAVVTEARRNLEGWGIAQRATVAHADLFDLPPDLAGPYDVVLSLQNLYYAPPDRQPAFVGALCGAARPGGTVVIATAVAADDDFAAVFDLLLRSSPGGHRLPTEGELARLLTLAGCRDVDVHAPVPRLALRVAVGKAGAPNR